MIMAQQRPVNLNITSFRFPLTAIVSIGHRISGVVLFLLLPLGLWAFQQSLHSPKGWLQAIQYAHQGLMSVLFWILLCALSYHGLAGIRHLLMDIGWGESMRAANLTAMVVLLLALLAFVLLGVFVW